jgi:hypothetical protein
MSLTELGSAKSSSVYSGAILDDSMIELTCERRKSGGRGMVWGEKNLSENQS